MRGKPKEVSSGLAQPRPCCSRRSGARKGVPVAVGRGPRSPFCPHTSESTFPVALTNAEISTQDQGAVHSLGLPPLPRRTMLNQGFPGNGPQEQHPHPPREPRRAAHTLCSISHCIKKAACPELTWGGSQGRTGSQEFGDPLTTWWSSYLTRGDPSAGLLLAHLPLSCTTTQAMSVLSHPTPCWPQRRAADHLSA